MLIVSELGRFIATKWQILKRYYLFFMKTSLLSVTSSLIVILWPLQHSHGLYTFSRPLLAISQPLLSLLWRLLHSKAFLCHPQGPFDIYKHYLMISSHSHGFCNTLTVSIGTLMTSKVRLTASFFSLTALTVTDTKDLENCWIFSQDRTMSRQTVG